MRSTTPTNRLLNTIHNFSGHGQRVRGCCSGILRSSRHKRMNAPGEGSSSRLRYSPLPSLFTITPPLPAAPRCSLGPQTGKRGGCAKLTRSRPPELCCTGLLAGRAEGRAARQVPTALSLTHVPAPALVTSQRGTPAGRQPSPPGSTNSRINSEGVTGMTTASVLVH